MLSLIISHIITWTGWRIETVNLALLCFPQPWHSSPAYFQTVSRAFQLTCWPIQNAADKGRTIKRVLYVPTWLTAEKGSISVHPFGPASFILCSVFIIIHVHAQEHADGVHHLCYLCEDKRETLQPLCWYLLMKTPATPTRNMQFIFK